MKSPLFSTLGDTVIIAAVLAVGAFFGVIAAIQALGSEIRTCQAKLEFCAQVCQRKDGGVQ